MSYFVGGAMIGSAALGYLGNQQTNKANQQIANTPQTQANSNQSRSSFTPHDMANPLYGYLGGIGQQMGQTQQPYFPGQGYIGPSAPTQAGMNMGMGSMPWYQQAAGMMGGAAAPAYQDAAGAAFAAAPHMANAAATAAGNYGFLSRAADVGNNPYVQGMMSQNARLLNRNFDEQQMPQIRGSSVGVNALGSSRQGIAEGLAARGTQEAISDANERLLLNSYGQGLGAQQSALGALGGLQQGMLAPSAAMGQAGGYMTSGANALGGAGDFMNRAGQVGLGYGQVAEDYQGRALEDAMNRFNYQYQEPWNRANNIGGILGQLSPLGVQNSSSAGTGAASGPVAPYQSPWMGALQGGMGGAMLGYGLNQQFGSRPSMGSNYGAAAGSLGRTQYNF